MPDINYRTYQDMATLIRGGVHRLPEDLDLIVGIPRSGMIPAYMIGLFMNKHVCSIDEYISLSHGKTILHEGERPLQAVDYEAGKRVLIVDDSVHSGVSITKVKERLKTEGIERDTLYFCAVYTREEAKSFVDYYFEVLPTPRIFEWNYLNHGICSRSCFDLDGVLCVDPQPWQNDDGEEYIKFIKEAKPLFIPSYPIKAIVTSRLEKYREQTEGWLQAHGVQYEKLYMLDLPSKEERIRQRAHGSFKAQVYSEMNDAVLFMESEPRQAGEIAKLTQKPAMCTSTDELYLPGGETVGPKTQTRFTRDITGLEGKRILLCTHELTYTGAPHSLLRICKILLKHKAIPEVWSREDGIFKREFTRLSVPVKIVQESALRADWRVTEIACFDMAICNTALTSAFYVAVHNIIPTIWYIREAQNLYGMVDNVTERLNALLEADELYCVSEYAADFLRKNYCKNVHVVPNCVEDACDSGNPLPNTVESTIHLCVLGTIQSRKGFDLCIDAFESLKPEEQAGFHMYFAGKPLPSHKEYWKAVRERVEANPHITYVGEIQDTGEKTEFYKKMNVVIVDSRDESCSLVLLEGAMMGKALIASENVGAKYMITEETGWIVETGSAESLANVFREMLRDPGRLESMGKAARKKYEETSTMEIYENNIVGMIMDKLKRSVPTIFSEASMTALAYQLCQEKPMYMKQLDRMTKERDSVKRKLNQAYKEKSEINKKLQQTYAEKSEINAKLKQTYTEKSEINAKLKQTYAEKSEINAKLKKTYEEKSEINAKLQKTYAEKSERGKRIQELEQTIRDYESKDNRSSFWVASGAENGLQQKDLRNVPVRISSRETLTVDQLVKKLEWNRAERERLQSLYENVYEEKTRLEKQLAVWESKTQDA